MTWIVGRAMPFGYAAAVSDVRATFDDGTEADCLQKIYPVGRFLAMGFAGSILIGAEMVQQLRALLHTDDPETAWDPTALAEWWPDDARAVFQSFTEQQRQKGCELLLLSAHPSEQLGDSPWPRCFVHRFRSPKFIAELAAPSATFGVASEVVSIGCGAGVELYREALRHVERDFTQLRMEVGNPGGMAYGQMFAVRAAIERDPNLNSGISPHVQVCIVRRGGITIGHYDRHSLGGSGGDLVMPPLATIDDFSQIPGGVGAIAGACC